MGEAVDVAGGVVVKRVSRGRAGFHTGKFHTATLLSRLWSHHRHAVISSPKPHPQGIQFPLDW